MAKHVVPTSEQTTVTAWNVVAPGGGTVLRGMLVVAPTGQEAIPASQRTTRTTRHIIFSDLSIKHLGFGHLRTYIYIYYIYIYTYYILYIIYYIYMLYIYIYYIYIIYICYIYIHVCMILFVSWARNRQQPTNFARSGTTQGS